MYRQFNRRQQRSRLWVATSGQDCYIVFIILWVRSLTPTARETSMFISYYHCKKFFLIIFRINALQKSAPGRFNLTSTISECWTTVRLSETSVHVYIPTADQNQVVAKEKCTMHNLWLHNHSTRALSLLVY